VLGQSVALRWLSVSLSAVPVLQRGSGALPCASQQGSWLTHTDFYSPTLDFPVQFQLINPELLLILTSLLSLF